MFRLTKTIPLVLLALTLILSGCGGGADTLALDPDEAAQAIMEQVAFVNRLTRVEGDIALNWYFLDDQVTGHAIYIDGGGGSAEEVAVLRAADATGADHLRGILEERLEGLAFNFENYRPGEMAKIRNPVIVVRSNVAIMVLADDAATAQRVVESLLS